MLGTLRLLLALAVAVSHAGIQLYGLNPGVVAVVGFYLISGYVMAGLIRRHYPRHRDAPGFYLDRAVRLMPQYLVYASLALAWHLGFQHDALPDSQSYFLSRSPNAEDIINNLVIVPLNYYMWNGSDQYTLIPPAWSLGAEIQFYLIAPFLLLWPRRVLAVGAFSIVVYGLALTGILNSDWYGYRLLPGVLSFFLLGALLNYLHYSRRYAAATQLVVLVVVIAALAWVSLNHADLLNQPYNRETLLGLAFGLLLLHLLAVRSRKSWDDLAGDISYGVFLNHFLVLWVFFPGGVDLAVMPLFLGLCVVMSFATQRLVERPLLAWRHRWRRIS